MPDEIKIPPIVIPIGIGLGIGMVISVAFREKAAKPVKMNKAYKGASEDIEDMKSRVSEMRDTVGDELSELDEIEEYVSRLSEAC